MNARNSLIVFTVLLLLGAVVAKATVRRESIIHVSHLSVTAVGISCTNGADPTGIKAGDTLVISCGTR